MPSPAAILDRFDSTGEKCLLQEILRRKLVKIPLALYPSITLDEILVATGAENYFPYHNHPLGAQVDRGATLGGILAYRGEIRKNITQQRPPAKWTFGSLLAYISSNYNSHMSFSPFFSQSRARLFIALQAKVNDTATKIQKTYMQACAEENNHPDIMSKGEHPTFYREMFVRALQEFPEDFDLFSQKRCLGILKDMRRTVDSVKDLDPGHPRFAKCTQIAAGLAHFFSYDVSSRPSLGTKLASTPGISHSDTIDLDVTKYQDCGDYRIFTGLIHSMPGLRTRETVDILNVDDLTDAVDVLNVDDLTDRVEGIQVAHDIGLISTSAKGTGPIDIQALDPVNLSHLGDVIMFDV